MNENVAIKINGISKKMPLTGGAVKKAFENLTASFGGGIITSIYSENKFSSSVLLKTLSEVVQPDSGSIETSGEALYIPAEASSFPWLTVKENLLFAVEEKDEDQIKKIIELIGLEGYEDHYCDNKSLGFRARIALGRALVRKPAVIAVDDVFKEMNNRSKYEILELIIKINAETKQTFIVASGNISDSVFIADELFAMNTDGELSDKVKIVFNGERNESLLKSEEFAETVRKVIVSNKS